MTVLFIYFGSAEFFIYLAGLSLVAASGSANCSGALLTSCGAQAVSFRISAPVLQT